jgi:hypothetical protein
MGFLGYPSLIYSIFLAIKTEWLQAIYFLITSVIFFKILFRMMDEEKEEELFFRIKRIENKLNIEEDL